MSKFDNTGAEVVALAEGSGSGSGNEPVVFQLACSDLTSALTVKNAAAYMNAPFTFTLQEVRASVLTAATSGYIEVDIKVAESSILSPKLHIDAFAYSNVESGNTPDFVNPVVNSDDVMKIDILAVGPGAKGLIVTIMGVRGGGGS